MEEKLKSFNINIDDIEPSFNYMEDIQKAIIQMQNEYDIKNLEVVLNKNIISVFDKVRNCRALFGCRVSFDNLDKDVSFIVRENTKHSYEELEQQLQAYKGRVDKVREILPLDLAIYFHETYERLAPSFGYETREETKQFDNNSKNGMLMVAVCEVILNKLLQILNKED